MRQATLARQGSCLEKGRKGKFSSSRRWLITGRVARLSGDAPTLAHFSVRGDWFEDLPGIGEKKRAKFGELVTTGIADDLRTNLRIAFD